MKANAYQGITKTEKIETLADFTAPALPALSSFRDVILSEP
jgi:hypothetical protein